MSRLLLLPPDSSQLAALAPLAQHDIELTDAEPARYDLVVADLTSTPHTTAGEALAALGVPLGVSVLVVAALAPAPAQGYQIVGWLDAPAEPAELRGAVRAALGGFAARGDSDPQRLLEQAMRTAHRKDEFISQIAHDLKNPMASIKGYADLMRRRSAKLEEDPNRKALEIISTQVARMSMLLDQLLDFSRISLDRLLLDCRPIDLAVLSQRLAEDVQSSAKRHTLHIEVAQAPLMVMADENRLRLVLYALLQNAIQFSPNADPITFALSRQDNMALIRVSDTGIGIPAADLPRIFEPYFRASNAEEYRAGVGIGLFLAQAVVQRHQGQILVESVEGQGSTFTVRLPLASADEAS